MVARWQVNVSNVAPNVSGHWEGSKNVKLLVARGWPEFCQVNMSDVAPDVSGHWQGSENVKFLVARGWPEIGQHDNAAACPKESKRPNLIMKLKL